MSFKVILMGIIIMFGTFMLFAMIILNMLPPDIYIYASTAMGIIAGLTMAVLAIMLNGVMGPFLSAKSGGKNLVAAVTASGNIRFLTGREKSGLTDTKDGYFLTPTASTYNFPNGVKGGFAFYKYGTTLLPKLVKGASKLKKLGINDIEELEAVAVETKKGGRDFVIRLD